jgi:hypothetical protein
VIQYGFEFIQSFGLTSGLIITFVVKKMKKLPFTEQVQKYVFPEFSGKRKSCCLVFGKVLVTERMRATSLVLYWANIQKNVWAYYVVSLTVLAYGFWCTKQLEMFWRVTGIF